MPLISPWWTLESFEFPLLTASNTPNKQCSGNGPFWWRSRTLPVQFNIAFRCSSLLRDGQSYQSLPPVFSLVTVGMAFGGFCFSSRSSVRSSFVLSFWPRWAPSTSQGFHNLGPDDISRLQRRLDIQLLSVFLVIKEGRKPVPSTTAILFSGLLNLLLGFLSFAILADPEFFSPRKNLIVHLSRSFFPFEESTLSTCIFLARESCYTV